MSFALQGGPPIVAQCPRASDQVRKQETVRVGRFLCEEGITVKQQSILSTVNDFFTDEMLESFVVPITSQQSQVSLRALDWLVTNFSKKHNIALVGKRDVLNIFQAYKNALSHFRRRNFDPFRRRHRISFELHGERHATTVGQLNFLHFVFQSRIYEYAVAHIDEITNDMNETARWCKQAKERHTGKRKRQELSQAAKQTCCIVNRLLPL